MTLTELLGNLKGVRRNGPGWMALCPAHEDRNPSLSVREEGGRILLHCHAGCRIDDILIVMRLTMADLFSDTGQPEQKTIRAYRYVDENGALLFEVVRYDPKNFRQRRPDANGRWIWNLDGVRRVLYNLPEVMKAKEDVLIVEGERDVETARLLGIIATCNPHGAGKWRPEYSEFLKGKRVVIIADADAPGVAHARDVCRLLVGVAESVRLIEALPQAKDLTEWVELGGGDMEGAREQLLQIVRDTSELTAADVARWETPKPESGFRLVSLGELLSRPDKPIDWVWQGRLAAGTVSAVVSKPKVGKSTFARNLCLAVSRGEEFLGLPTKGGLCIYLALEERFEDVTADFRAMGATGDEPILIHADTTPESGVRALIALVREQKPVLVVIDPLFRMIHVKDEKAYAEGYKALGPLIDIARATGTHLQVTHHSGKALKTDAIDSPLGTTAIGGAVNSLLVLKRTETYRTIQTVQRLGEWMPETVLQFDSESRRLSVGGTRFEAERQECQEAILEFLKAAGEGKTEPEIDEQVDGKTILKRKALRALVAEGRVTREGSGKKGNPYKYLFPCSNPIVGTREQES
jgi:hypothetical protein